MSQMRDPSTALRAGCGHPNLWGERVWRLWRDGERRGSFGYAQDDSVGWVLVGLVAPLGFVGGVLLLLGVLEVFEEVGVEDGGGDFVVARGPLAEVDGAAALGAEGDFGGVEGDFFAADGAVEGFGHGGYAQLIL
jgi:hypothetical protein